MTDNSDVLKEVYERTAQVRLRRVLATLFLGLFTAIGWTGGMLARVLVTTLNAIGWAAGVVFRSVAFCCVSMAYGFYKGAGLTMKKDVPQAAPPGQILRKGPLPGTYIEQ